MKVRVGFAQLPESSYATGFAELICCLVLGSCNKRKSNERHSAFSMGSTGKGCCGLFTAFAVKSQNAVPSTAFERQGSSVLGAQFRCSFGEVSFYTTSVWFWVSQFRCSFGEVSLKLRQFGFGCRSFDAVSVKFR